MLRTIINYELKKTKKVQQKNCGSTEFHALKQQENECAILGHIQCHKIQDKNYATEMCSAQYITIKLKQDYKITLFMNILYE